VVMLYSSEVQDILPCFDLVCRIFRCFRSISKASRQRPRDRGLIKKLRIQAMLGLGCTRFFLRIIIMLLSPSTLCLIYDTNDEELNEGTNPISSEISHPIPQFHFVLHPPYLRYLQYLGTYPCKRDGRAAHEQSNADAQSIIQTSIPTLRMYFPPLTASSLFHRINGFGPKSS
jgi:hypothetical protein